MKLKIYKEDCHKILMDRNSTLNAFGTEGFYISFGNLQIHFEDETDAVNLAKGILSRMGLFEEKSV